MGIAATDLALNGKCGAAFTPPDSPAAEGNPFFAQGTSIGGTCSDPLTNAMCGHYNDLRWSNPFVSMDSATTELVLCTACLLRFPGQGPAIESDILSERVIDGPRVTRDFPIDTASSNGS